MDSNEDGKVDWTDQLELWVMRMPNRAESRITINLADPSEASWHPSKMELTFIATNAEGSRGLYTYDLPSKSLTRLTGGANSWPAWSPSGEYIAFYDDESRVCLFSIPKKTSTILSKKVGNGWSLHWTPRNQLVFVQKDGKEWRIFTPGTKEAVELNDAEHAKMNVIEQNRFGWASTKVESGRGE